MPTPRKVGEVWIASKSSVPITAATSSQVAKNLLESYLGEELDWHMLSEVNYIATSSTNRTCTVMKFSIYD